MLAHPKCKEHGRKHLKLDIDISTRPEHGLGLFAYCHNDDDVKRVCFKKDDVIVEYIGDIINKKECRPTRCIINECKLPCHFICLQRWFDRYNKCPICNANWDEIPIGYTIQKIKDKVTYKIE